MKARRAIDWLRANVEYAPFAAFLALVAYVQIQFPHLFVLFKLLLIIVLAAGAVIAYTILRDGPTIVRTAAAQKLTGERDLPTRTVKAHVVEPPHRAVPAIPVSTYVMPQVPPPPIDVDDETVTIPMPPPPDPLPVQRVEVVPGRAIPWPHHSDAQMRFTDPFAVGVSEDGTIHHLTMRERNLLLGGETGGGKSNIMQIITAAAALDPQAKLYLFDAKRIELNMWRGCAAEFVENNTRRAIEVLDGLLAEMDRRYVFMQKAGLRSLPPAAEFPTLVWICDELAEYTDDDEKVDPEDRFSPKLGAVFSKSAARLASLGRAAGIIPIAATQEPRYDVVPPKLRNKFVFRIALRCQRQTQRDIILGDGWEKGQAEAHKIRGDEKGVGFLLHEGAEPVRVQFFYLSDSDIRAIARRAERLRSDTASPTTSGTTSLPLRWPVPKWTRDAHEAARSAPEVVTKEVTSALDAGWSAYRIVRDVLGWPADGERLAWHKEIVLAIGEVRGPRLQVVRDADEAGEEA